MSCSLSPDRLKQLLQTVAVELKGLAATKDFPFNLNEYVQSIYDLEMQSSNDPESALFYAQAVPMTIDKLVPFLPEVKELIKKNIGLTEFDNIVTKFKNVDYVQSIIISPAKEVSSVEGAIKKEKDALQSSKFSPEVESIPTQEVKNKKLKPKTMSATHTNYNLIRGGEDREKELARNIVDPNMVPYLDFQERLVSMINKPDWKKGDPILYPGVVGGLWLTAVSAKRIPENQLYPSTIPEYLGKTVVMVVTNKEGEFLYFNKNGKIVPATEGKIMYYNMRTIPEKSLDGQYDYAKSKVQTPKEIADASEGRMSEAQAKSILDEETAKIERVYDYINANPTKNKLIGVITGGTAGTIKIERENAPLIGDIDLGTRPFDLTFELSAGSKTATTYIQFEGSAEKIPTDQVKLENEDISKIARLLVDDVHVIDSVSKASRILTNAEKVTKLQGIIYLKPLDQNKDKQRMYVNLEGEELQVFIDGNLIDLSDKEEAKRQIEDVLVRLYESTALRKMSDKDVKNFKGKIWEYGEPGIEKATVGRDMVKVKTPEGNVYHWVQGYTYNIDQNMFKSNAVIDAFTFENQKDGSTLLLSTPVKYRNWVAAHTKAPVQLNADKKPVMLNGYLTYGFSDDTLKKIEDPQAEIEVPKPSVDISGPMDLTKSDFEESLDKAIDEGLLRRIDQKETGTAATKEQIAEAKTWYESHPMSKYIPFHQAFNLINTKTPNGIAEWTTQGITLFMGSDYSDLYHEAWHGFTQMFLTKKQKTDLYNEAGRRQGSFKDYNGNYVQFSKATVLQLEEFMAEQFREFMLSGGKVSNLSSTQRSIFQKILDFLKAFFEGTTVADIITNRESVTKLNELFSKLRMGNISEFTFDAANRNFHVLNKGITKTTADETLDSLEYFDSKLVVDSIDSLIVSIVNAAESKRLAVKQIEAEKVFQETGGPIEPSIRKVLDIAKILKDPQLRKGLYQAVNTKLKELHNKINSEITSPTDPKNNDIQLLRWVIKNYGNTNDPLAVSAEDGVMAYHFRKSKFLTFDDVYGTLEEDEPFTRFDRAGNEQSMMEMAIGKDDVIALLNGIYVPEAKTGEFNRLGIRNLIEPELVWNELAKILEGGLSMPEMFERLKAAQTEHPITIQLLNKLGDPNARTLDGNVITDVFKLWSNFHQVFDKVRIPLVQVTVDQNTGKADGTDDDASSFTITFGSTSARTAKIEQLWNNQFKSQLPAQDNYIRKDDKGNNYLDLDKLIPAKGVSAAGAFEKIDTYGNRVFDTKKGFEFLHAIGVTLTDTPFIRDYVTSSAKEGELKLKMLYNRLRYIRNHERRTPANAVMDSMNAIFKTNWTSDLGDANTLLENFNSSYKNLTELEARYSPFATPMVTNASGDTQYEHSLQSSISKMITAINAVSDYNELMTKYPYMSYLDIKRNPFAKSSRMLAAIFDFSTPEGVKRVRNGEEVRMLFENYSGIALTKDNIFHEDGVASASADTMARRLADFHAFVLNGYTSGFQASDKSTTVLIGTTNLQPIGGEVEAENPEGSVTGAYYVDMPYFAPSYVGGEAQESRGRRMGNQQMIYYLEAELKRMMHMENLPDDAPEKRLYITTKDGKSVTYYDQGKDFVIFDDILKPETKTALISQSIKTALAGWTSATGKPFTLVGFLRENNLELYNQITIDLNSYFNKQVDNFYKGLEGKQLYINENATRKFSAIAREQKIRDVRPQDAEKAMVDSYVYNYWMHNYELMAMIFGDIAQYNHNKEEFHKRDSSFQSTGEMFANDFITQDYINNTARTDHFINSTFFDGIKPEKPIWNGEIRSAVMADKVTKSLYDKEYATTLLNREKNRLKNSVPYKEGKITDTEIEKRAKKVSDEYLKMKEGDAQGWISFDGYRALAIAQSNWTDEQETLFHKILSGEYKSTSSVEEYFPVRKFQYAGYMKTEGLPAVAFHKFSLLPLIPGITYNKGSNMEKLAIKMAEQNIHYSLFQTGSKVLTLTKDGNLDEFYGKDRNLAITEPGYKFTPNILHVEYLKDQLKINAEYKGNVTFSTQMRKLIELGLMEGGVPTDFKPNLSLDKRRELWDELPSEAAKKKASNRYILLLRHEELVAELTETKKQELIEEAGLKLSKSGEVSGDISGIIKLVRRELTRQDLADHEIDFFDVDPTTGKVKRDGSFAFSAEKVERVLMALVNKRLVRQKTNGESLVLVSGAGLEDTAMSSGRNFEEATSEELKKWGTNDLPSYHIDPKSKITRAMKVKIALQGDFRNLLRLDSVIARAKKDKTDNLTALNSLIKEDNWLNQGDHRQMVTMVGVRIPVQGLNSMEFMEVYEFLPEAAGNILIPPAEIVAKAGSDFDIDKLSVLMPNIVNFDGKVQLAPKLKSKSVKALYELLKSARIDKLSTKGIKTKDIHRYLKPSDLTLVDKLGRELLGDNYAEQLEAVAKEGKDLGSLEQFTLRLKGKYLENELLFNTKSILELPENYENLIRPNSKDLVEPTATDLASKTRDYDPLYRVIGDKKKNISPSRVFEIDYNLFKQTSNNVGKQALGIGAVDNSYNAVFNRLGAYMNSGVGISKSYYDMLKARYDENPKSLKLWEDRLMKSYYPQTMYIPHNTITVDGDKVISLSNALDVNNENNISDIISQLINGWVDVAKDAWIFDIQGNKQVSPVLLYMIQAGVPFKHAVYLVSNPLVRQYIKQQQLARSTFSGPLKDSPVKWQFFAIQARTRLLNESKYGINNKNPYYKSENKKIAAKLAKTVTDNPTILDEKTLYNRVDDKSGAYTDTDRAAFFQYMLIEDQAKSIRDLKLRTNPDTKRSTTIFEGLMKEADYELLFEDSRLPDTVIEGIMKNSPIASFGIQRFAANLWKPLFTLRVNDAFNEFIIEKLRTDKAGIENTFDNNEKFVNNLRNDLPNYLFQRTMRDFDINATNYKGFEVEAKEGLPTESALTRRGVYVVDDKIFVDKKQLENDFQSHAYSTDTYTKLTHPLAKVTGDTFKSADEYYHFVFEREYIRSRNNLTKLKSKLRYQNALFNNLAVRNKIANESAEDFKTRMERVTYEELIRDMALENILNPHKLFESSTSYAQQFMEIRQMLMKDHPEILERFQIFNNLGVSMNAKGTGLKNIHVLNTKMSTDMLNSIHSEIQYLANPTEEFTSNPQVNQFISDFFQRMPYYSMLQSGMGIGTKFSLGRMLPVDSFTRIMEEPGKEFVKKLNKSIETGDRSILDDFYAKFKIINNKNRAVSRIRLKNYMIPVGPSTVTSEMTAEIIPIKEVTPGIETYSGENLGLVGNEWRTKFGPKISKIDTVMKLITDNPDKLFVYNSTVDPTKESAVRDFIFSVAARRTGANNVVGIPVRLKYDDDVLYKAVKDNHISDETYEKNIVSIDNAMDKIAAAKAKGMTIVFSEYGYGQALAGASPYTGKTINEDKALAPKTFLHLSQKLMDLGYKNNNFDQILAGREILQKVAGVYTDQQVEDKILECYS